MLNLQESQIKLNTSLLPTRLNQQEIERAQQNGTGTTIRYYHFQNIGCQNIGLRIHKENKYEYNTVENAKLSSNYLSDYLNLIMRTTQHK